MDFYKLYPIGLAACLSACTTYPLPQDTSGYNTYQIVANIRCEARDAIRKSAIFYLNQYTDKVTKDGKTGPQLADLLDKEPRNFEKINIDALSGDAKKVFSYYRTSQVAYEFSLKGVESTTQGFDLGLDRSFGLRKDTLGFKSELLQSRDMTRSFFVWDRFEKLIALEDRYCRSGRNINIVYPITGAMPVSDLIMNYIEMNELKILAVKYDSNKNPIIVGTEDAPAIPAMGDTIIFKTRLDGNINPAFNYNPVGAGLLVSALTLKNENYRDDTHTLTITVSTAPEIIKGNTLRRGARKLPPTDQDRLTAARDSVNSQRKIRLENSIINLSNSLSRIAQ